MVKSEKIASSQMVFLLVTLVSATAFLFVPAITSEKAAQNGWLSVLVPATAFGLIVGTICIKLGQYFPDQSVVEYAPNLVGKFFGRLIGLSYIFFFIHVNAVIVREFGDFLVTAFMPETPLIIFNVVVVALAGYAVRNGIEVIARMNQFVFPLFIGVWFMIIALNLNNLDFENLLPLLDRGIKPVLAGAITPSSWRGEVVLILMFLPFLNKTSEAFKTVTASVIIVSIILTSLILVSTMVFGSIQEAHFVFPSLALAKYVSVGNFIERIEAIIVVVWVAGITVKVALFFLASVLAAEHCFKLKNHQAIIFPVGIITLIFSQVLFENSRELVHFLSSVFPYYAFTFELFIPAALLLVAYGRKKAGFPNAK